MLVSAVVRAETDSAYKVALLTENFPPYNMAVNGKNFARDENISGIAVELVREMFKRAGVDYSLTLRFPWARIYKMALEQPGYGVFCTARLPEREKLVIALYYYERDDPRRPCNASRGRAVRHRRTRCRCVGCVHPCGLPLCFDFAPQCSM